VKKRLLFALIVLLALAATVSLVSANGGLVSYWPLDEGSGDMAYDTVNGNNGTIVEANWVDGKFGTALDFDGVDDYINIPDHPSLDITGDLTLAAWIKIDEFLTSEGLHLYIVSKDTLGAVNRSYGIGVDLSWGNPLHPFFIVFGEGSYDIVWGTGALALNTWYHITGVFDASSGDLSLYIDGGLESSESDTINSINAGGADLRIGARQYTGSQCFFNGVIDEVGLWNRTLSADEVAWLASPEVNIDIKPGSDPNSINLGSKGVIPVAILSSDIFDATQVDPDTVSLAGAGVAVRGKGNKSLAHQEDVNGDGLLDLVVQLETENLDPNEFQDGTVVLEGRTFDSLPFRGEDEIVIVPPD
jgi:hypothetical protein